MSKFEKTHCSQCGGEFGPGDSGYSHCSDHWSPGVRKAMSAFEAGLAKRWAEEFGLPWHIAPWGDGSKPSVVNICSESHAAVVAADLERDVANWIVNTANAASAKPEGLLAGGEQVLAQASHKNPPAEEDRGERARSDISFERATEMAETLLTLHERGLQLAEAGPDAAEDWAKNATDYRSICYVTAPVLAVKLIDALALSSPRVEEVRREALEEAAKVAETLAAELARIKGSGDRRVQIGSHLETCATIAAGIRALSLQVG